MEVLKKMKYNTASIEKVGAGIENLVKHIENCKTFGITPTVAINYFPTDTQEEIDFVIKTCADLGVEAVLSQGFAKGGEGTSSLAQAVVNQIDKGTNRFERIYDWDAPVKTKIHTIATTVYGADDVEYSALALRQLRQNITIGTRPSSNLYGKNSKVII